MEEIQEISAITAILRTPIQYPRITVHCTELSQIVNIIDDKNRAAIGAASETSMAGGGGGSGVIRERDGNDVQAS